MKKDNILSSLITFYYIPTLISSLISITLSLPSILISFSATAAHTYEGNFCRNHNYTHHMKKQFSEVYNWEKIPTITYIFFRIYTLTSVSVEIKLKQEKKFIYTHVINSIKLITPHTFTRRLSYFLHWERDESSHWGLKVFQTCEVY